MEQRLLRFKKDFERRMKEEKASEIRRFKEFELSSMRLEEAEKYRRQKEADREELTKVHTQRLERLKQRERDTMERCKFKMKELEAAAYEHRQQVLRDMELIKQKEDAFLAS